MDGRAGGRAAGRGRVAARRRDRLHGPRPRGRGRRRAGLRAQPLARRLRGRAARLRGQRRAASAAARLPAAARGPRLVRDDERQVARADHGRRRAVPGLPDGHRLPHEARRGRPRHAGHADRAALADDAAGDPGLHDASALPAARPRPARGPRMVGLGSDRACGGGGRRRLGRREARRGAGAVRLGVVVAGVGRDRGRARAVLPAPPTPPVAASRTTRRGTSAATPTTRSSASPSPSGERLGRSPGIPALRGGLCRGDRVGPFGQPYVRGAQDGYARRQVQRAEQSWPARPEHVGAARRAVWDAAARAGAQEPVREAARLAVSEAVSNVVVHSYRDTGGPAPSRSASSGAATSCA